MSLDFEYPFTYQSKVRVGGSRPKSGDEFGSASVALTLSDFNYGPTAGYSGPADLDLCALLDAIVAVIEDHIEAWTPPGGYTGPFVAGVQHFPHDLSETLPFEGCES